MNKYGTTREQLAAVSAKNSLHGSLNPYAQYRAVLSVEDVLNAKEVVWPFTLPMCSPIGDGASAVIIVSEKKARELGMKRMVKVEAAALSSGYDYADDSRNQPPRTGATEIYEEAGVGPDTLDCVELSCMTVLAGIHADKLLKKGTPKIKVRKGFVGISTGGTAICLILLLTSPP